jgi:hypothetical protein
MTFYVDARAQPWNNSAYTNNTGITVTAGQRLTIVATGYVKLGDGDGPWLGPDGCPTLEYCGIASMQLFFAQNLPAASLIGKIGTVNKVGIGSLYDAIVETNGPLYLAMNDSYFQYEDNLGGFYAQIYLDGIPACPHDNIECPFGHCTEPAGANPIKLRTGEKVLSETDLNIQTPAEPLTFTRSYTQGKQSDAAYQFMGLAGHTATLSN